MIPPIDTHSGRRAWAFLAIWGGSIVFTGFAAVAVWLVSGHAEYSLYMGLAAHLQILVGMTALGWAMGRRVQAKGGRDGFEIDDSGSDDTIHSGDAVTVEKAETGQ